MTKREIAEIVLTKNQSIKSCKTFDELAVFFAQHIMLDTKMNFEGINWRYSETFADFFKKYHIDIECPYNGLALQILVKETAESFRECGVNSIEYRFEGWGYDYFNSRPKKIYTIALDCGDTKKVMYVDSFEKLVESILNSAETALRELSESGLAIKEPADILEVVETVSPQKKKQRLAAAKKKKPNLYTREEIAKIVLNATPFEKDCETFEQLAVLVAKFLLLHIKLESPYWDTTKAYAWNTFKGYCKNWNISNSQRLDGMIAYAIKGLRREGFSAGDCEVDEPVMPRAMAILLGENKMDTVEFATLVWNLLMEADEYLLWLENGGTVMEHPVDIMAVIEMIVIQKERQQKDAAAKVKVRVYNGKKEYTRENGRGTKEQLSIVYDGEYGSDYISCELVTGCKRWKTAVARFFKALESDSRFDGWKETVIESIEYSEKKDGQVEFSVFENWVIDHMANDVWRFAMFIPEEKQADTTAGH